MTAKDIKRQDVIHGMAVQFDICIAKYYRLFVNIISAFLGRWFCLTVSMVESKNIVIVSIQSFPYI